MDRKDFTFWVKSHKTKITERGKIYTLTLYTPAGHRLVFKSADSSLFEGYPINTPVGVKLVKPQTTLPVEK